MVFEEDKRQQVDPKDLQKGGRFRSIVKLQMHFYGQSQKDTRWAAGSGWLVRPDLLVTAGHCVFDRDNGLSRVQYIKAYVGYHGKDSVGKDGVQFQYGAVVVTPSAWVYGNNSGNGNDHLHDFAFIKLAKPFEDINPLKYEATPETEDKTIGIVGYPADKVTGNNERGANMYQMFARVKYNLKDTKGMLGYNISTYAGQSGSPVLLKDSNVSIATHVAGTYDMNLASPIGTDVVNPYAAIIHFFFGDSWPSGGNVYKGIELHNVPKGLLSEDDASVGPFPPAWRAAKEIGGAIPSDILTKGTLFKGLVGSPVAALAGTILGYAGKVCESAINNGGALPTTLPDHTGYAERAVLGEAALQYLLDGKKLPEEVMKDVVTRMKNRYKQLHPLVIPAAPFLLRGIQDSAARIALDHVRVSEGGAPTPDIRPDPVHRNPSSESAMDPDTKSFEEHLLKAMPSEESFFETVLNIGGMIPGPIGWASTGLSLLSGLVKSESAMENDDEEQALTGLASRAILGEAALDALIHTDHEKLESEGFFPFIGTVAKKLGNLVLSNAPKLIDTAAGLAKKYLESKQSAQSGGSEVSFDDLTGAEPSFTYVKGIPNGVSTSKINGSDILPADTKLSAEDAMYAASGYDGLYWKD